MHRRIQTYQIEGKDHQPNLHGPHQTVCQKWKRIGNPNAASENIQSTYRDGIRHLKIRCANKEKRKKQYMTEGIELPNEEKIQKT